jgi:threonine aldolase
MNDLRYLDMHKQSHQYWLDKLQHSKYLDADIDSYNQGELMDLLEQRVAKLLGKEQALFFHKGTIAQLAALKVAANRRNNSKVVVHPQSHIVVDESDAYQTLMGLEGIEVGTQSKANTFHDIEQVGQNVGSVCIELPLRRAGFKLAEWSDLQHTSEFCRQHHIHLHMDGARLWESIPYYSKQTADYSNTLTEVSSLFDSVYVSLYKGLGGMGGSLLAGDADFINECKVWRHRLGGSLWTAAPMLITALDGLDQNLPIIEGWVSRAANLAESLSKLDGLKVNHPQTNSFLVYIQSSLADINQQADKLTLETGLNLFSQFFESDIEGWNAAEIKVLNSEKHITNLEIINYFSNLLKSLAPI